MDNIFFMRLLKGGIFFFAHTKCFPSSTLRKDKKKKDDNFFLLLVSAEESKKTIKQQQKNLNFRGVMLGKSFFFVRRVKCGGIKKSQQNMAKRRDLIEQG